MKLHHLRDVVAVAERGGLRAAARHLNLAQPALTRSLGEIERELGAALFERGARGTTLTASGEAFVARARAILNELRRAGEEVAQMNGGVGGHVAVALSIASHIALLPAVLRTYYARYPAVQLRIIEGIYPTVEAGLREGAIDFYVGPEPWGGLAAELLQERLFENTRVVLGRAGHPLADARTLAALAGADWATTSVTLHADEELGALFRKHRLPPPRLALQSQSALTLVVALANTDLLAVVPAQWENLMPLAGTLAKIPIREVLPAPDIVLIRRTGLPLPPAAAALADLLRRAAETCMVQGPPGSRGPSIVSG